MEEKIKMALFKEDMVLRGNWKAIEEHFSTGRLKEIMKAKLCSLDDLRQNEDVSEKLIKQQEIEIRTINNIIKEREESKRIKIASTEPLRNFLKERCH